MAAELGAIGATPAAGTILCCLCGVAIPPNPVAMCAACVAQEYDITEGIPRTGSVSCCKKCGRWETATHQWVRAERESGELLTLCLRRVGGGSLRHGGRGKVQLKDAGWVWTEPHSRRLKFWISVQGEVESGATLRQRLTVEFKEQWRQCDDCSKEYTGGTWKALVQLRQRADHKRTMLYLEQRLIQAGFEQLALDISPVKGGGLDFYFADRHEAAAFLQFIGALVPLRLKASKKLVGFDTKSNVPRHQHTTAAEVAPTCKDDLVLPTRKVMAKLGPGLPLVRRVTSQVKLVNPSTGAEVDVSTEAYWKKPFVTVLSASFLTEFVVLDVEPCERRYDRGHGEGSAAKRSNETVLAEAVIARESDFGVNDETMTVVTHLGGVLRDGDVAFGYDLNSVVLSDDVHDEIARAYGTVEPPDVILVKRKRDRAARKGKRKPRLRRFYEPGAEQPPAAEATAAVTEDGEGAEEGDAAPAPAPAAVPAPAPVPMGLGLGIAEEEEGRGGKKKGRRKRDRGRDTDEKDMADFMEYLEHDTEMAAAVGFLPAAPVESEGGGGGDDDAAAALPPAPVEDEASRIAREALRDLEEARRRPSPPPATGPAASPDTAALSPSPIPAPAGGATSFYDDGDLDAGAEDAEDVEGDAEEASSRRTLAPASFYDDADDDVEELEEKDDDA